MDYAGRKKQLIVVVFLLFILSFSSCYYDNFDELYPAANTVSCDTVSVTTYSKHVFPILNLYCNSCHSTKSANGSIILDTFEGVRNTAISGKLLGSLKHTIGYKPMPLNTKLDDCYIHEIENWIQAGEPNN